ncbi:MAG: glycosyltransferase family 39 protein [Candidatus Omnitrophica bacterium]|nr:glycosyltransferase family 39 protein [Candidatus Omnitrophota bacterium]
MNISRSISKDRARGNLIIPIVLVIAYFLLQLSLISLPGIFCDEAIDANLAIRTIKGQGTPLGIDLFGRRLPLMMSDNHSALTAYLLIPFLQVFGARAYSLRLLTIFVGSLTLLAVYLFTKELFDRKSAILSMFLLVINFAFLVDTKMGIVHGSMMQAAMMFALLCLLRWYRSGRLPYFFTAMFLLGIGISIKLWFIWFVLSLFICALIFRHALLAMIGGDKRRYISMLFGPLFFGCGALLILLYNIGTGCSTLRYIFNNAHFTIDGADNFAYFGNLALRSTHLLDYIKGVTPWGSSYSGYSPIFFLLSVAWLLYLLAARRSGLFPKNRVLFLLILTLSIFLQSPFTMTTLKATHIFLLFPLLQIISGVAFIEAVFYFRKNAKLVFICVIILFVSVFVEAKKTINGYLYFQRTGGEGLLSDSINSLSGWLMERKGGNIIILDWGISDSLYFLTRGEMENRVYDLAAYCSGIPTDAGNGRQEEFMGMLSSRLRERDSLYVCFYPNYEQGNRCWDIFRQLIKESDLSLSEEKRFYQRDGRVAYAVFSLK